ncbi:hypothetical protein [Methylomonas rapida]|uniref:DUF2513 domain-containing protein n=1 Tax=Methylomonas rapida TaxID=2963939 RepID=A0ABY7GR14_9GAMM|nr:hypothetical protein [Methylomonas rapida]WAR46948.1 hypothetical protein NM686_010675 [Methylomonas rapida]
MSQNIDDFNRFAAKILERMYEAFPQDISPLLLDGIQKDLDDIEKKNLIGTFDFLATEGFIRCSSLSQSGDSYSFVKLTGKGLLTLNLVPKTLTGKKASLLDKIKAASKDGGKQALNAAISQTIAAYVRMRWG